MVTRILLFSLLLFQANILFSQATYYTSTARPPGQLEKTFPFNIDLKDPNGNVINSAKLFKKHKEPTVFLFWLTTCGPCRMEIAAIQAKYVQWKTAEKFRFVVISYDFPDRYDAYVKRATEEKWAWETFHDINKEFGSVLPGELNGLPQVFLFDKNGELSYQKRKYMPGDENTLFDKIVALNKK